LSTEIEDGDFQHKEHKVTWPFRNFRTPL